jgi:hypothetical protein
MSRKRADRLARTFARKLRWSMIVADGLMSPRSRVGLLPLTVAAYASLILVFLVSRCIVIPWQRV